MTSAQKVTFSREGVSLTGNLFLPSGGEPRDVESPVLKIRDIRNAATFLAAAASPTVRAASTTAWPGPRTSCGRDPVRHLRQEPQVAFAADAAAAHFAATL